MKYLLILVVCIALLASGCRREIPAVDTPTLSGAIVSEEKSSEEESSDTWTAALEPRELVFPADHRAHPDFRIEWWYYTGNLTTKDGRRFGYQLTFFRTGLQRAPKNPSRWTVRDLYTAHFAISDVANTRFFKFERTHRGGVDWAGVDDEGRVWNGNWELNVDSETEVHNLHAMQDGNSIELSLMPAKPLILHGNSGLSRKGATPGNASYYYSFTRLNTSGKITVGNETFDVQGTSWMDHEFSSSFLEKGQSGWDWFSIQLDSGEELMLYQMRLDNGAADPHSSGTWIAKDGAATVLSRDDFVLEPLRRRWHSKPTGADYPIAWRVRVPSLELDVTVTAVMPNQEMDTSAGTGVIYWEGCVDIAGTRGQIPVKGRGYLEMTGYAADGVARTFLSEL
jgi:predicted secreted hydrolase